MPVGTLARPIQVARITTSVVLAVPVAISRALGRNTPSPLGNPHVPGWNDDYPFSPWLLEVQQVRTAICLQEG